MNTKKLVCPQCNYQFDNESDLAQIVQSLRDQEFAKELQAREQDIKAIADSQIKAREAELKNQELQRINQANEASRKEIEKLNIELTKAIETAKNATLTKEQDIAIQTNQLQNQLKELQTERDNTLQTIRLQNERELEKLQLQKEQELQRLQLQNEKELERLQLQTQKQLLENQNSTAIQIQELQSNLAKKDLEAQTKETALKSNYEFMLKQKEEELAREKELKSKLNVKLLGESLEQHCEIAFNRVRSVGFPNAYFEKDNKVVTDDDGTNGSKGDYIFKEYLPNSNPNHSPNSDPNSTPIELISIMFEMKNEEESATNKKKHKDYLAQLDKNRNKKSCEYAVMVSTLEKENDLYNDGIYEVYDYPKMYIIRPQFFIPLISLLTNAARKNAQDKAALITIQQQNIDITHFEEKIEDFKQGFTKNYNAAQNSFEKSITEIDKAIEQLQKSKEDLQKTAKQLGFADDKVAKLTIRSLTKGNPTMKAKFDELRQLNSTQPT